MPSITVENYVKQLYLAQEQRDGLVPMGDLARIMGVVPGTATTMIKTLADAGLVRYEPRTGVRLTRGGERLALHVLRRHRLVELLLVKVLGLDWSEVHGEAEELEHAISDKVVDRIDALLGHPHTGPHGDPIPTARGSLRTRARFSLGNCPVGRRVKLASVPDEDPGFLRFLKNNGLTPGSAVTVEKRDAAADSVIVRTAGKTLTLGTAAAAKILVKP